MNETIEAVQELEKAINTIKTIFEKKIYIFLLESGNQEFFLQHKKK